MSGLHPECNQNESPIQFILISSLNTHISRIVKLFAWTLNLRSINLIILAGVFYLRSLVPNPDCILKCRLITSFQYTWNRCFAVTIWKLDISITTISRKKMFKENLYVLSTIFFHLYFINKHKRKLIMEVNFSFWVLTASPHRHKTIKWKLQKKRKKKKKISSGNHSLFNAV